MSNEKLISLLVRAIKLALLEFDRISYQKKPDPVVVRVLRAAIYRAEGMNE